MKTAIYLLVLAQSLAYSSSQDEHSRKFSDLYTDNAFSNIETNNDYYGEETSRKMQDTFLNPLNWFELVRNIANLKTEVRQLTHTVGETKIRVDDMERNRDLVKRQSAGQKDSTRTGNSETIENIYFHLRAIRAKLKKKGGKKRLNRTKAKAKKVNQDVMTVNTTVVAINTTVEEFIPTVNISAIQAILNIVENSDTASMLMKLTETVTALETKITTLETSTATMTTDIATLKTNEAALTAKITALETKTTTLETTTGTLTTDVAAIKTDTATLKTDVASLKTSKCDTTKCTSIETDLTPVMACMATPKASSCKDDATYGLATGLAKLVTTPPAFNCVHRAESSNTDKGFSTSGATIAPYTCPVTTDGMDITTGVFTVATAGYYRLTFMARCKGETKKIILKMMKNDDGDDTTYTDIIGRALTQVKTQKFEITTNIDIIELLAAGDKVDVKLQTDAGVLQADHDDGPQLVFTGTFLKPAQ